MMRLSVYSPPGPDSTGGVVRAPLRLVSVGAASVALALAASVVPVSVANAVDFIRIDSRDHPADLDADASLGQSLTLESDVVTIVGGMFATYNTTDSGFRLSLHEDGPEGP